MMQKQAMSDKEFISNPADWPRWPFMPMKRQHKGPGFPLDFGLIVAGKSQLSTLYLEVSIWDSDLATKILSAKKKVYASIDDMLADGWVCD